MHTTLAAILLAIGLVLPSAPLRAAPATPASIDHPTGADDAIIRVTVAGGMILAATSVRLVPVFALYGDGLAVIGPEDGIDLDAMDAALPVLRSVRLTGAGIQTVLAAAASAGLTEGDRRYDVPGLYDAPTTFVTVNTGGRISHIAAYALGLNPDTFGMDLPDVAARAQLEEFLDRTANLAAWLPPAAMAEPETVFSPDRVQLVVTPAGNDDSAPIRDWPLATPLAGFGDPAGADSGLWGVQMLPDARCGVVTGDDAKAVVAALTGTSTQIRWRSNGEVFALFARPLLPDEIAGCPPRLADA